MRETMAEHKRISQIRHNGGPEAIEGDAIQAMFHQDEERHLDKKIEIMKCYTVAGYECAFAPTYNRVAVHAASLDIDRKLTADPLTDDGTIPKTYFNFLPYEQLSTKLLKNQQLTDYIGKVEDLEWAEIQKTNSVLRMKVTTPGCKPVTVALWKEIHLPLDLSLITDVDEEVIVAFTALKVMPQQSGLQLQSSGGTRVIINPQIPLAQEMAERFRAARMGTPVSKITLRCITHVDRISESDITTIGHLYQQDIQALQSLHTVEATITEFTEARGWFFVNCTACGCRIYEKDSVYSCDKHKQQHLSYR
ncbi:hypothetical protein SSX86_019957 [Deinandra increscens subsp. villosa]|uniref:Uncharacterized protein n=1 Tax=Deinandra increscens subsp. villosa TaxID=3103831 RepID=A0AAP0CYP1_9ASTR